MLLDAEANIFAKGYYESALDAAEGGKCLMPTRRSKDTQPLW